MSFSVVELRAIRRYAADEGLIPQLSVRPRIAFKARGTGHLVTVDIDVLVDEYKAKLKDDAKARLRKRVRK